MNDKNTVATAQESKTTKKENKIQPNGNVVTKVPTGKFISKEEKDKRRKEREEQYQNFRINALKRRAKRMKLSEEDTNKAIEELKNQLKTPNNYDILVLFNPNNADMIKQALINEKLNCKIMSTTYLFIEGDVGVLNKLREIIPPGSKIHPYVKKKPPILQTQVQVVSKKKPRTKTEKKELAAKTKLARKKANMQAHANRSEHAKMRKAEHCKRMRAINKAKKLFEKRCQKASKKKSGIVVNMTHKKPSQSLKKASRTVKKAA